MESYNVDDSKRAMDVESVDETLIQNKTFDEIQSLYTKCAQKKSFDQIIFAHKDNCGAIDVAMKTMVKLFAKPQDVLVLDLGSATGTIGRKLSEEGFKNIHALDPCEEFNKITRSQGIHKRIMEQSVGFGVPVNAENDTYDAIVTVGTFCPGHVPCDSLHECIRILKPGGYFINCMREEFLTIVPEYKDRLEPLMEQLVEEGKWKKIVWERYANHYKEKDGIVMVFQVCSAGTDPGGKDGGDAPDQHPPTQGKEEKKKEKREKKKEKREEGKKKRKSAVNPIKIHPHPPNKKQKTNKQTIHP